MKAKRLKTAYIPAPALDQEVLISGGRVIPILGVANGTGKPRPAAAETAKRIAAFVATTAPTPGHSKEGNRK